MRILSLISVLVIGLVLLNGLHPLNSHSQSSDAFSRGSWVSSWYWVRAYGTWLEQHEEATLDNYSIATALDPERLSRWRLAAQTIAFDFPAWSAVQPRSDYGKQALEFYERSRPYFEGDPEWFETGAFLAETAAENNELAMSYLEEGVKQDGFPYLLGKRYVNRLDTSGRVREALSFLKAWQSQLTDDPYPERREEIAAWILSLEKELNSEHPR